ncbi:hypothetical protein Cob_v009238 [Colletotrichum orbiculare MAFF 240422]|uniref:Uncharacterized protein n=1 Tax=Colletotrichum orbiculare (strain 104-T / ATCC 96160 / CBS 514.97 / LARS 414 / MAFF 240422) TaxID=1213857 RepID=A0A484FK10_COLOR|nr:hypothetical protein Cob_v009238 [Colletotrichum orbiculare MAFF 240422]
MGVTASIWRGSGRRKRTTARPNFALTREDCLMSPGVRDASRDQDLTLRGMTKEVRDEMSEDMEQEDSEVAAEKLEAKGLDSRSVNRLCFLPQPLPASVKSACPGLLVHFGNLPDLERLSQPVQGAPVVRNTFASQPHTLLCPLENDRRKTCRVLAHFHLQFRLRIRCQLTLFKSYQGEHSDGSRATGPYVASTRSHRSNSLIRGA